MQKVTLVDTSCLILLTKIGRLNLLKSLFGNIFITKEVAVEFGKSLPDWVTVVETPAEPYETLRTFLDSGEASVLAVARLADDPLLVIDEVKGRKVAIQLGIAITGTLGLIKVAIHKGLVENPEALVEQIRKTDFRLSGQLIDSLLPKQK